MWLRARNAANNAQRSEPEQPHFSLLKLQVQVVGGAALLGLTACAREMITTEGQPAGEHCFTFHRRIRVSRTRKQQCHACDVLSHSRTGTDLSAFVTVPFCEKRSCNASFLLLHYTYELVQQPVDQSRLLRCKRKSKSWMRKSRQRKAILTGCCSRNSSCLTSKSRFSMPLLLPHQQSTGR